jgi:REP element-mobilizing transposase RayT
MARKPRIHYPGALYHGILRGNAGDPVFFDDADRCRFYLLLQEGTERFGYRVHAFCCMTNHVHIALQVGEIPLSRIMQNLSLRYTAWINRRRSRTGHVFQGRYKALLIDGESYLMELVRYIHLNPVRAGIVGHPVEFPWSGHRHYLGEEVLPWLTSDWTLNLFSPDLTKARKAYATFVNDGMDEGRRSEFHSGFRDGRILGDDRFTEDVLHKVNEEERRPPSINAILDAICSLYGLAPEVLCASGKSRPASEGRALAALLVREAPNLSLTDLGRHLNREVAALSQAARRLAVQVAESPELAERLDAVAKILGKV